MGGLPVIAITTDTASITSVANESHYDQVFARQIQALGQENDLLLVLTTSGNSNSILHAVNAANERGMDTIALNGRDGGILPNLVIRPGRRCQQGDDQHQHQGADPHHRSDLPANRRSPSDRAAS